MDRLPRKVHPIISTLLYLGNLLLRADIVTFWSVGLKVKERPCRISMASSKLIFGLRRSLVGKPR